MAQLFQEVEWLAVIKGSKMMEKVQELIEDYEENRIDLDVLQEIIWGLSESELETIAEDRLRYYLSSTS